MPEEHHAADSAAASAQRRGNGDGRPDDDPARAAQLAFDRRTALVEILRAKIARHRAVLDGRSEPDKGGNADRHDEASDEEKSS
jgi:hypothetical protein